MLMDASESQLTDAPPATLSNTPGPAGRWWFGVGVGAVVVLPFAFVLSYLASLPFMLGMFFFALFGLVVGAVAFRVSAPARPVPRASVVAGTAIIVLVGWSFSLVKESRDFPHDMGDYVVDNVQMIPEGMDVASLKQDVVRHVRQHFEEHYGSAGFLGYVQWTLTDGSLDYPVSMIKNPIELRAAQARGWWAVRVLLCGVLLAFGVYSQLAPLARPSALPTGDPETQA